MADPVQQSSATLEDLITYINDGANDLVKSVLENQCNIKTNKNITVLAKKSVETGNEDILLILLEHGLNANCALDIIINSGKDDLIDFILDQGAEVDEGLYFAVKADNMKMINTLVNYGGNINTIKRNGKSLLQVAIIQKCNVNLIEFLIKNNVEIINIQNALKLVQKLLAGTKDLEMKEKLNTVNELLGQNISVNSSVFECLQGLPDGLNGYSYQIKLFTLCAIVNTKLAMSKAYQYELGTEVKNLLPFDDIYLRKNNEGQIHCEFIQVKQTRRAETKKMEESKFFTMLRSENNIKEYIKGNDLIIKMFIRFNEITKSHLGQSVFGKFLFCTNTDWNTSNLYMKSTNANNNEILCKVKCNKWIIDPNYLYLEIKFILLSLIGTPQYLKFQGNEFRSLLEKQMETLSNFKEAIVNEHQNMDSTFYSTMWQMSKIANDGLNIINKYLKYLNNCKNNIQNAKNIENVKMNLPDNCEVLNAEDLSILINRAVCKINEIRNNLKIEKDLFLKFSKDDEFVVRQKIQNFAKQFYICTNCPNSDDLEEIIITEIQKEFKCDFAKLITAYCLQYISKWIINFKDDKGILFTDVDGKNMFRDIRIQIFKALNKPFVEELQKSNILFKEEKSLQITNFLNNNNNYKILHIVTQNIRLHTVNIYQTIKILKNKVSSIDNFDNIIFTTSDILFKSGQHFKTIFDGFSSFVNTNDLLIFEFADNIDFIENFIELMENFKRFITCNTKTKLIIITKCDNRLDKTLKYIFGEYIISHQDKINFKDLVLESQQAFLNKNLIFQNHPHSLTTNLRVEDFLTIQTAQKVIDENILSTMVTNSENITLGNNECFISEDYNIQVFISRYILKINIEILKYCCRYLFFITGITKKDLSSKILINEQLIHFWEDDKVYEKGIVLLPESSTKNFKTGKEIFTLLYKNCNHTYWLEFKEDFIYRKDIKFDKDNTFEEMLIDYMIAPENLNDKIVLVANNPGEGKSTMLTHLAFSMRNKSSNIWIIRVDLRKFADESLSVSLKNIKFNSDDTYKAIEIISLMVVKVNDEYIHSRLEMKLLQEALIEPGIIEVVLLFDGFDEISPGYKENTCVLLKALSKSNVKQIWVTTRVHLKEYLEEHLQVPALSLASFTETDQIQFLSNFWRWHLTNYKITEEVTEKDIILAIINQVKLYFANTESNTNNYDDKLIILADSNLSEVYEFIDDEMDLLNFSATSLKKWKNCIQNDDFLKVPLNLEMLAKNTIQREWKISNFKNIYFFEIYKEFVGYKLKIYQKNKSTAHIGNQASREQSDMAAVIFMEMHREIAVRTLFEPSFLLPDLNICTKHHNFIESLTRIGMIKSYGKRIEFIHRSFAEYFFGEYLAIHISHSVVQSEFLGKILFSNDYHLIRTFFDGFLLENQLLLELRNDLNHETIEQKYPFENILIQEVKEEIVMRRTNDKENILHVIVRGGHIQTFMFVFHNIPNEEFYNLLMKNSREDAFALHLAINKENIDMFNVIVDSIKKLNFNFQDKSIPTKISQTDLIVQRDKDGSTPLHLAALKGLSVLCFKIIDNVKYDENSIKTLLLATDRDKRTALHLAASEGSSDICDLILTTANKYFTTQDLNIEDTPDIQEAFGDISKTQNNKTSILKELILQCDKNDETALYGAIRRNHLNTCEVILEAADKYEDIFEGIITKSNYRQETALHIGAQYGYSEICNMILKFTRKYTHLFYNVLFKTDMYQNTAFCLAIRGGHVKVYNVFLENSGNNKNILTDLLSNGNYGRNENALHIGVKAKWVVVCECILQTVENQEDFFENFILQRNNDQETALHLAARNNDLHICFLILDVTEKYETLFKKLVTMQDIYKMTVLHIAASQGNSEICDLILNIAEKSEEAFKELIFKYDANKNTALDLATQKGHIDVYTVILKNIGKYKDIFKSLISINYITNNESLLHKCVSHGQSELCDLILNIADCYPDFLQKMILQCDNNGDTVLHLAARLGHLDICNGILKFSEKYEHMFTNLIMRKDSDGLSALQIGAWNGQSEICDSILKTSEKYREGFKQQLLHCNGYKRTALHLAAWRGHTNVCIVLMNSAIKNATVYVINTFMMKYDCYNETALHLASQNGHVGVCDVLLTTSKKYGSYIFRDFINQRNNAGETALHIAAWYGHSMICNLILNYTKKYACEFQNFILKRDNNKNTAFDIAIHNGHADTCQVILNASKKHTYILIIILLKYNNNKRTPLHLASQDGHVEVCNAILETASMYTNILKQLILRRDNKNWTPLHLAAQDGNVGVCKVLLKAAENISGVLKKLLLQGNNKKKTVLHLASQEGHSEVCNILLSAIEKFKDVYNILILKCDNKKETALHIAAQRDKLEVCKVLLEASEKNHSTLKDNLLKYNNKNKSAFHLAAQNGHEDVCKILIAAAEKQSDIFEKFLYQCDNKRNTALHLVSQNGHAEVCNALLIAAEKQGLINKLILTNNNKKQTALHLACQDGHLDICNAILRAAEKYEGVLENLMLQRDINKMTALNLAMQNGRAEVSNVLLKVVKKKNGQSPM